METKFRVLALQLIGQTVSVSFNQGNNFYTKCHGQPAQLKGSQNPFRMQSIASGKSFSQGSINVFILFRLLCFQKQVA